MVPSAGRDTDPRNDGCAGAQCYPTSNLAMKRNGSTGKHVVTEEAVDIETAARRTVPLVRQLDRVGCDREIGFVLEARIVI